MNPTVTAVIQARMGSSRLPGKVLLPLGDFDVLTWVVERVQQATRVDQVFVATSTAAGDDPIAEKTLSWPSVGLIRGPEQDVLGRYALALDRTPAEYFVRITSDCPLIDPQVIDEVICLALESGSCDYASNTVQRSYPRGLDVEVVRRGALVIANNEATKETDREHVTPFIWRQPLRFGIKQVQHPQDLSFHRWTLDTEDDYKLLQSLCEALGPNGIKARFSSILDLFSQNPNLITLNSEVRQRGL